MIRREEAGAPQISHQVVISELMALNTRTLADEDGDYSDWFELYNRGDREADLGGAFLTDDRSAPQKWPLPHLELAAGESVVIFASGKDRRSGTLHTNFRLDDGGEFLGLVAADGTLVFGYSPEYPGQHPNVSYGLASPGRNLNLVDLDSKGRFWIATDGRYDGGWTEPDFDDTAWPVARGGVGFEEGYRYTNLIGTHLEGMYRRTASAYLRIPFVVSDPGSVTRLVLRMRYDDGFVAFLNGQRVVAGNAPRRVEWSADAPDSRPDEEAMVFEELDLKDQRDLLVEGRNVLAIHGLNASRGSKDFLIVPTLEAFAGEATLGDEPLFLERPSPGQLNGAGFESLAPAPVPSLASGLYFGAITVSWEPSPGGTIRYTVDGTLPDRSSQPYQAELTVERSTVLRARQFLPGHVPSEPRSAYYAIADPGLRELGSNLPMVVVETFGRSISPDSLVTAFLTLFNDPESHEPLAHPTFAGKIAIKNRGSTTLRYPKRSYALEVRDALGQDRNVALLGMPADSDWILYAPYNYDRSLIRNALVYELSRRMGRYAPRSRFVEVFVHSGSGVVSHDDYRGVYALMEKIKRGPHRVAVETLSPSHRREPRIAGGYILKIDRRDPGDRGFSAAGQDRLNYVYPKEAHITPHQARWIQSYINDFGRRLEDGSYEESIDVASWIDYHLLQELTRNPDGHRYSTFLFKTRAGKLEMGPPWDFDRAMGADDTQRSRTPPDPSPVGRSRVHSYGWWETLMADPRLVRRYRDRWLELRQGPLQTAAVQDLIDQMEANLQDAQVRNFARWPIDLGSRGWPGKIHHLRSWMTARVRWMDAELIGPPGFEPLPGAVATGTMITVAPVSGGEIFYTLDGSDPRHEDGGLGAAARSWHDPIPILGDTVISARERIAENLWGALERREYRTALRTEGSNRR